MHNNQLLPDCLLYDLPSPSSLLHVCVATVVERANYSCGTGRQWQRSGSPGEEVLLDSELIPDELAILISSANEDFFSLILTHLSILDARHRVTQLALGVLGARSGSFWQQNPLSWVHFVIDGLH